MNISELSFSIPDMLAIVGLAQCVYVLVYMAFRSGDVRRAVLPFVYFFVLGTAFFLEFAGRFIGEMIPYYDLLKWLAWFGGLPLGVLLVEQVAQIDKTVPASHYRILFLLPLAFGAALALAQVHGACWFPELCSEFDEWLTVTGLLAGALSLLSIWLRRDIVARLFSQKTGRDRYWVILMLVFVNLSFLMVMFLSLGRVIGAFETGVIRTALGLGFAYLAGTSLFRIYPQALQLVVRKPGQEVGLTPEDQAIAQKIQKLFDLDKIYQEPECSRAMLARELQIPETVISRIINLHFGKSFPQLLNERRVEDAKRLLKETDASVKVIAGEVGFASMASFNRVFRNLTGMTPSELREKSSVVAKG